MADKIDILNKVSNPDQTAEDRKKDHIELALNSKTSLDQIDRRFSYEPILYGMPDVGTFFEPFDFAGKQMILPIWVSSMTGGTKMAGIINRNLARACGEFGMGMGLGSCRQLLFDDTHFEDFNVRKLVGDDQPLYANLGIAQVEQLIHEDKAQSVVDLVDKLQADGLIIHINPLQEWFQPEGDRIIHPPIDTIKMLLEQTDLKIIVKEVGQGMGRESLQALMQLPIQAIDFGAMGGTNFSKIELTRDSQKGATAPLAFVGHDAGEMVQMVNDIMTSFRPTLVSQFIVSGGIRTFLDGYYHTQKLNAIAVYGQASALLEHARGDYDDLRQFLLDQGAGLAMAYSFLKAK